MSIASCIIDLNNSAWIMISVAMICATVIIYIGCLFGLKFKKYNESHKHSCNRTTTVKYKDNEVVISDEEND